MTSNFGSAKLPSVHLAEDHVTSVGALAVWTAMKVIPPALAVALVFASMSVPFLPGPDAGADDGLFARLALNILQYGWLGPYNVMTLTKGPFYPLFLAASSLFGLPVLAVQTALYAVASLCLARAIGLIARSDIIEFASATILLVNPALFAMALLHVVRDGIYAPLSMLVVALALLCFIVRDIRLAYRLLLAGGTGFVLGTLWLTREEGIWIVPPLLFIAVIGALGARRTDYRSILTDGVLCVIAAGTAMASVSIVCLINERQYGVGDVTDFRQPEFVAAYSALSRIGGQDPARHVRIGWARLEQAYQVSPAAAELRPHLARSSAMWVAASCSSDAPTNLPCDGEIHDAWMLWALRSAADAAGHYSSAQEARDFFGRLAHEVDTACNAGRLTCGPPRHSLFPPMSWHDTAASFLAGLGMLKMVVTLDGTGAAWDQRLLRHSVSCLIPDPPPLCRDEAWFFEIAHTRLFTLGPRQLEPSAYPDYERAEQASRQLPSVQFSMAVVWLLYRIRLAFTAVLPWLSGFALICFVGAGAMQLSPMRRNGVWVAASICALVIASRIGLLALIDVTMMDSARVRYLAPIYPFLLVFCILGPVSLWRSIAISQLTDS